MWFFDCGYIVWLCIPILCCSVEEWIVVAAWIFLLDGIECSAITNMSSATQNWLNISDGQAK